MKLDEREVTVTINDMDNLVFNAVVKALKVDVESSDRETLKQAMRITDSIMAVLTDIAAKQAKSAAGRKAAQARYAPPEQATAAVAAATAAVDPVPVKNKGGRPRKNPLAGMVIPTLGHPPAVNGPLPAPAAVAPAEPAPAPMLPKVPAGVIVPPFGG